MGTKYDNFVREMRVGFQQMRSLRAYRCVLHKHKRAINYTIRFFRCSLSGILTSKLFLCYFCLFRPKINNLKKTGKKSNCNSFHVMGMRSACCLLTREYCLFFFIFANAKHAISVFRRLDGPLVSLSQRPITSYL